MGDFAGEVRAECMASFDRLAAFGDIHRGPTEVMTRYLVEGG